MHKENSATTVDVEKLRRFIDLTISLPRTDSSPKPLKPGPAVDFNALMLDRRQMKRPHRVLHVVTAFIGETSFIAMLILIPLLYTHTVDLSGFQSTYLIAPPTPPPPPPHVAAVKQQPVFHMHEAKLYTPTAIPKHVAIVKDQPPQVQADAPGVFGGVPGGVPGGTGGVIGGILGEENNQVAPPPPAAPHGPYHVGGNIQAPRQIKNVQPVYPVLARETKVNGSVAIDCVIDEHGNVIQMQVVSGHPLLVQAALQAVAQWKYEPTLLNGKPIDIRMIVTVNFNLSHGG
jgi:periplasmic protein TonB